MEPEIPGWVQWLVTIILLPLAGWLGIQFDAWRKQRAAAQIKTLTHEQNADDDIRRAMLDTFSRMSGILETQMREIVAIQFELSEIRRDGRVTAERTARIETLLSAFGGPFDRRGWPTREADANE